MVCDYACLRRRMAANPINAAPNRVSDAGSGTTVSTSDCTKTEPAATPNVVLTSCHPPVSTTEGVRTDNPAANALNASTSPGAAPSEMKAMSILGGPGLVLILNAKTSLTLLGATHREEAPQYHR